MRYLAIITLLLAATVAESSYASSDIARGKILVANEALSDPNFDGAVILIVGHENLGTLGLIINRRLSDSGQSAYFGGPVRVDGYRALVASSFTIEHAIHVEGDVYFLDNPLAFNNLRDQEQAEPGTVKSARTYVGISSWLPGQLEAEIRAGAWYVLDSEEDLVFSDSESLWEELITRIHAKWVDAMTPGNSARSLCPSSGKKSLRDVLQPSYNGSRITPDAKIGILSIVTSHIRNRMF